MKTIWKFELSITDIQTISMPRDARILSVQTQFGKPCIWAIVSDDEIKRDRTFIIHGTGHPCSCKKEDFIGTFLIENRALVFHLFERLEN